MQPSTTQPLILTLTIDPESQTFFNGLRTRFFPPERNFLQAHITLFHHLPSGHADSIEADLLAFCSQQRSFPVQVEGLRNLGRGVAYALSSPPLQRLREELAGKWTGWLTLQDQQKFKPHVTVQNKVTSGQARETLALLSADSGARVLLGLGLDLWEYEGGPWRHRREFPFLGAVPPADANY